MERQRYSKPPLTEVVIDIRASSDVTLEQLSKFSELAGQSYTQPRELHLFEGKLQWGKQAAAEHQQLQNGWLYPSADQRYLVQVRLDGFAISRVTNKVPYDSWEVFAQEAKSLWAKYATICGPYPVQRVAVRYINRFFFKIPFDLKAHFSVYPEIAGNLPQLLSNFLVRLVLPNDQNTLLLTQTPCPAPQGFGGIILDLDLYREDTGLAELDDNPKLWSFIEELHKKQDIVFEGCITDATRELIR